MTFEEWWEEFTELHEEWRYADSEALRKAAFEAGRQAEREECAKVCEKERVAEDATHNREDAAYNMAIDHVVAAIRARGTK